MSLNLLSVGSNPKLVYYSLMLQATSKFDLFMWNSNTDDANVKVKYNNETIPLQPFHSLSALDALPAKFTFDIILLSSTSLQDISNISAALSPYLSKTSILLIESTGYVNLEPFLKNCLPSIHANSIFSMVSNIDIRRVPGSSNEFTIIKPTDKINIIVGESSTKNAKITNSQTQDLLALQKLFQYYTTIPSNFQIKPNYLDFLIEQWKLAIPKICFDPLLVLFEEATPAKLSSQILAKPLLSGLITEMITVAKAMGCKLPIGFDNESNLFNKWCSSYDTTTTLGDEDYKYLHSPQLFYDFYNKYPLNVDLLLLQPILLADDHGIKTPYLEFLYATTCQLEKLNHGSIFFKRIEEFDQLNAKHVELNDVHTELNKKLNINNLKINELNQKLTIRNDELSRINKEKLDLFNDFNQLNLNYKKLSDDHRSKDEQIRYLQQQVLQAQQSSQQQTIAPTTASSSSASSTAPQTSQAPKGTPPRVPQSRSMSNNEFSATGTPDLTDLSHVAVFSASMDSPLKNQVNNEETQASQDKDLKSPPPVMEPLSNVNGSANNSPNGQSKEQELMLKEQMLRNKEIELNKKLLMFRQNQQHPGQQHQHQQQQALHQSIPPHQGVPHGVSPQGMPQHGVSPQGIPQHGISPQGIPQHGISPQGVPHNGMSPQNLQNYPQQHSQQQYLQLPPQQQQQQQQQQSQMYNQHTGGAGLQPALQPSVQQRYNHPPQPRRVSTMPLESEMNGLNSLQGGGNPMMNNNNGGGANGFSIPKKTSRKNRKSSFPLVSTQNIDSNMNFFPPVNNNGGGPASAGPMNGAGNNSALRRPSYAMGSNSTGNMYSMNGGNAYSPTLQQQHSFPSQQQQQQQSQLKQPQPIKVKKFDSSNESVNKIQQGVQNTSIGSMNGNVTSNGNGYSSNGGSNSNESSNNNSSNNSNSNIVMIGNGETNGDTANEEELSSKPLGGVINNENGKEKKKNKKFGLFKK